MTDNTNTQMMEDVHICPRCKVDSLSRVFQLTLDGGRFEVDVCRICGWCGKVYARPTASLGAQLKFDTHATGSGLGWFKKFNRMGRAIFS